MCRAGFRGIALIWNNLLSAALIYTRDFIQIFCFPVALIEYIRSLKGYCWILSKYKIRQINGKTFINSMLMKYRYETVIIKLKYIFADLMEIYIKTM